MKQELLNILRCPACERDGAEVGLLDLHGNWLICRVRERKYPTQEDIPVMLSEEGHKYRSLPENELPTNPGVIE